MENKKNLEDLIVQTVEDKLNDGSIQKMTEEMVENCFRMAMEDLLSYGGALRKQVRERVLETMTPVIEQYDFNRYLVKLDTVLTEVINNTSLADNKEILEGFRFLMTEPKEKIVPLSRIWAEYRKFVAVYVETDGLEVVDGEYESVPVRMELDTRDTAWGSTHCTVTLRCEHDEDGELTKSFEIYHYDNEAPVWWLRQSFDRIDLRSLRSMSPFDVFIARLDRAFCRVKLDMKDATDHVQPTERF